MPCEALLRPAQRFGSWISVNEDVEKVETPQNRLEQGWRTSETGEGAQRAQRRKRSGQGHVHICVRLLIPSNKVLGVFKLKMCVGVDGFLWRAW